MLNFDRERFLKNILCTHIIDIKIRDEIMSEYNKDCWNEVVEYIYRFSRVTKLRISRDAFLVCKRLAGDFKIELFPVVFRTYTGHWQRSAGAFSWFMLDKRLHTVGSQDPLKKFIVKRNRVDCSGWDSDLGLCVYAPNDIGYHLK